jgi:hypothetical protein
VINEGAENDLKVPRPYDRSRVYYKFRNKIDTSNTGATGPGVAYWLRRCGTSREAPGSIPVRATGDFSEASDKSMCPGSTRPFEMSIKIFLWVKTSGA